jgi:hypothetical protein
VEEQFRQQFSLKADKIILYPEYTMDKRLSCQVEYNIPPKELYLPIGHNQTVEDNKKHYRRYYDQPLESMQSIFSRQPFDIWELNRDNRRAKRGFFSFSSTVDHKKIKEKITGLFKGLVNVCIEKVK